MTNEVKYRGLLKKQAGLWGSGRWERKTNINKKATDNQ